jgi:hypothetical protein
MKKFCLIFVVLSLFVFAGCGSSKSETKNDDKTDPGETVNDDDPTDSAPSSDDSDTTPDTSDPASDDESDTAPDTSDPASDEDKNDTAPGDDADPAPDGGDTADDSDTDPAPDEDADTAPALPECKGASSVFPCKDAATGYIWSSKSNGSIKGINAAEYCENNTEGGLSWKLPDIDEIRTLVKGCENTKTGGECQIGRKNGKLSQNYWSSKCYCSDDAFDEGIYSIFGDTENWFWSSSLRVEDSSMWSIDFHQARVTAEDPAAKAYVRCVVNEEYDGGTISECSKETSSILCKDSATGYIWSEKSEKMKWEDKTDPENVIYPPADYCEGLNTSSYGGFSSGWRLPTISELRTLIQNCQATQMPPAGNDPCLVREDSSANCLAYADCWTESSCNSCTFETTGIYSKLGDIEYLWSSSSSQANNTDLAWCILFSHGSVLGLTKGNRFFVRCVRDAE